MDKTLFLLTGRKLETILSPVKYINRKIIAIVMLLWMPLFGVSALAATVPMQLRGECHGAAMPTMQHDGMVTHQYAVPLHGQHGDSCNDCGICHLACSGYLVAPAVDLVLHQQDGTVATHFLVSFTSLTSAPLDPPPLARS